MLEGIELERTDDHVYNSTTAVISSVMNMTQTATEKNVHLFVPLVKVNAPVGGIFRNVNEEKRV